MIGSHIGMQIPGKNAYWVHAYHAGPRERTCTYVHVHAIKAIDISCACVRASLIPSPCEQAVGGWLFRDGVTSPQECPESCHMRGFPACCDMQQHACHMCGFPAWLLHVARCPCV